MKKWTIIAALGILLLAFSGETLAQGGDPLDHDSNKGTKRAELANGGWHVVYGKTFEEGDWIAVAACTYYGCLGEYFDYYLDESIKKFEDNAAGLTTAVIKDIVLKSVQSQGRVFTQGKLQVSAGIATYSRWKRISYGEPYTYECWYEKTILGQKIKTKGICTGMKQVERQSPLPNHHQPYVRFRISVSPAPQPSSGGGYDAIHFKNNCSRTIFTAIQYKNLSDQWTTEGWWEIPPGGTKYVAQTKNSIFYTYAESKDPESNRLYWSGTDTYDSVKGSTKRYGFAKRQITTKTWGTWTHSFSCN